MSVLHLSWAPSSHPFMYVLLRLLLLAEAPLAQVHERQWLPHVLLGGPLRLVGGALVLSLVLLHGLHTEGHVLGVEGRGLLLLLLWGERLPVAPSHERSWPPWATMLLGGQTTTWRRWLPLEKAP